MVGFQPRADWVREMKRYGVLAKEWKSGDPMDVRAVEQDYWKSLWHSPVKSWAVAEQVKRSSQ